MVKVSGNSMYSGICAGDILVVDMFLISHNLNNKVIVAQIDGEFNVKRLKIKDKRFFLIPDNVDFPTREIKETDNFEVWVVVTGVVKIKL